MLLSPYYQEIARFQVLPAIVDGTQYVLKLVTLRDLWLDACNSSSGDVNLANKKAFTILVVSFGASGIVEAMGLLLGVLRLYYVDEVSKCETE